MFLPTNFYEEPKFNELSTEEDPANGLRFLWKSMPQIVEKEISLIEETIDAINKFPDVEIDDVKQLAVDEFARKNLEIPEKLMEVLPMRIKKRYEKMTQLQIFEENGQELDLSIYSTDELELLLDILEQYPVEHYVSQVIDVCFDYDIKIENRILERILNAFNSFCKEIRPNENYYRYGKRWILDISNDPGQVYKRNRFRTNRLLQWLSELPGFSSLEMTEKMYNVAKANDDDDLKEISIQLLHENRSDDVTSWLIAKFEDEKSARWELQREIIKKFINFKAINTLEKIAKNNLGDYVMKRQAFVLAALFKIYQDNNPENLNRVIQQFKDDFKLLKELKELPQISPFIRVELSRNFVESRNYLTLEQAKVVGSLSENDKLIEEVKKKLTTKSAQNRFVEYLKNL